MFFSVQFGSLLDVANMWRRRALADLAGTLTSLAVLLLEIALGVFFRQGDVVLGILDTKPKQMMKPTALSQTDELNCFPTAISL